MSLETGLVQADPNMIIRRVNTLLDLIQQNRKMRDEQTIINEVEFASKRKWFGLVPGKLITREEAIRRLDESDRKLNRRWRGSLPSVGWRFYGGLGDENELEQIKRMCELAIFDRREKDIYLSGKQISLMDKCERRYYRK